MLSRSKQPAAPHTGGPSPLAGELRGGGGLLGPGEDAVGVGADAGAGAGADDGGLRGALPPALNLASIRRHSNGGKCVCKQLRFYQYGTKFLVLFSLLSQLQE